MSLDIKRQVSLLGATGLCLLLGACAQPAQPGTAESDPASLGQPVGQPVELHVFAAASLTDVMPSIAAAFEAAHPAVKVIVNLAGTQQLRAQVESGAACDAFLSANPDHANALTAAGLLDPPKAFVRNEMVCVASTKSGRVKQFSDLGEPGIRVVICAAAVPAGKYAEKALKALAEAGQEKLVEAIRHNIASYEENVQQAVAKIELGEADGGILYATDAKRSQDVTSYPLPDAVHVEAIYLKAIAKSSKHPETAREFLDFLAQPPATAKLTASGFAAMGAP